MLTFLNGENSNAYQVAMHLDNKLKLIGYGFNYYQILGLNISYTKEELDKNYNDLINLMGDNSELEEEKTLVIDAHRRFTSFLGSAWYEKDIGSYGRSNVCRQYEVMKNSENMFLNLKNQIGNKLIINYIEKKDNSFVENKIVGLLKNSDSFKDISVECINDFNIDFLGQDTAILKITDMSGKEIYSNEYLLNPDKRNLYSSDEDIINGFKIASWGFYNVRKLELEKNQKSNNNKYLKKI